MRKALIVMQMSMIFLALACPSVDAAITWDEGNIYNVFHYGVQNSGQFYNKQTDDYNPAGIAEATEESTYGATASASLSEFAGMISLSSTAAGPVGGVNPVTPPAGGLQVRASAVIAASGLAGSYLYGVDIKQNVVSYVTRRFRVTTPWHLYAVKADLSGVVDFNDFGSGSYQGTHSVQGTVELWESLDDFNQDFRKVYSWPLSESVKTISVNVNLRTDARYELKIRLTLDSEMVNMIINPSSGTITISGPFPSGNYKMGSASSPLALKAIIFDLSELLNDDGVNRNIDNCPDLYNPDQQDSDRDGVGDVCDNCPSVSNSNQLDYDGDHVGNACDGCPNDPLKIAPGLCGCGNLETDSDRDGTPDCNDGCPSDPLKIVPGICGCDALDTDSDGDGTPDCNDLCPNDPAKTAPGICGCGVPDRDSDGDGIPDCNDGCPNDPLKIGPGLCGCGVADRDSDGDGTLDCNDGCPNDPLKIGPGLCGCGSPDKDTNGDGIVDCPKNSALSPGIFILLLGE